MLYVLRLSSGDCIVTAASNERRARELAGTLGLEQDEIVVDMRPLSRFAVRFSPTDCASLEVNCWDDSTLDDILRHEYPLLEEAFRLANSVRFMPAPNASRPVLEQMKSAFEQNTETIRQALREEIDRLKSPEVLPTQKTAHK